MPDSNDKEIIKVHEVVSTPIEQSAVVPRLSSDASPLTRWLWMGFVFLVIVAAYVVFFLPSTLDRDKSANTAITGDQSTIKSEQGEINESEVLVTFEREKFKTVLALDGDELQIERIQSEQLIAKIIALEANLDKHGVKKWAAEEFYEHVELGRIGDEYFRRQEYVQAIEAFQIAVDELEELQQRIEPIFERALSRGEQALTQGDQFAALQHFELAISIFPKGTRAINGLQRATTLEQLFALLQRGNSFEFHNQLLQAKLAYQQATELDSLSIEAQASLMRVDTKLKNEEFYRVIATGYEALNSRQYVDARAAFNAAKKLKPKANESIVGLNKVAVSIRQEKMSNFLFEAEHFVQLQQWPQAALSYEKILNINKNHEKAKKGLRESDAKAKILEALKAAVNSGHQLYEGGMLDDAEKVLASAAKIESPGSIIEQYNEQLKKLVRIASTPVPVIFLSDDETEVIVLKVKRLGKFSQHELQLRPGPYTIVGVRNGFRDVRKKIQVISENKTFSISIVCEESI